MKIRQGRRNLHNLYLQLEDQPSNQDPCLGFFLDGRVAEQVAADLSRSPEAVMHVHNRVIEGGEVE